jgi:mannose-6-phosphate isomerase-like protein (cupin superfamily)
VRARRAIPKARDLRAALRGKPKITSDTTYEAFKAACPTLSTFDKGKVTLGRFATQSPWENHPEGDEFLYVVDGKIDVVLLCGDRRVRVPVRSGSIFLVPQGVWHRQVPRPIASVLSALPTAHGPVSWEDDPRRAPKKPKSAPRSRKAV